MSYVANWQTRIWSHTFAALLEHPCEGPARRRAGRSGSLPSPPPPLPPPPALRPPLPTWRLPRSSAGSRTRQRTAPARSRMPAPRWGAWGWRARPGAEAPAPVPAVPGPLTAPRRADVRCLGAGMGPARVPAGQRRVAGHGAAVAARPSGSPAGLGVLARVPVSSWTLRGALGRARACPGSERALRGASASPCQRHKKIPPNTPNLFASYYEHLVIAFF